jgi:hypothetical protein
VNTKKQEQDTLDLVPYNVFWRIVKGLFRRGIVKRVNFPAINGIEYQFSQDDLLRIFSHFDFDKEDPTLDDLKLFTGRDRFAEPDVSKVKPCAAKNTARNRPKP